MTWFRHGLRFDCTQCGECCRMPAGSVVLVSPEEVEAISAHLGRPVRTQQIDGDVSLRAAGGWCEFYDPNTKRCTVYAARPAQCRTFPFWPANTNDPMAWTLAAMCCEGIGRGELISEEEITARIRAAPAGLV